MPMTRESARKFDRKALVSLGIPIIAFLAAGIAPLVAFQRSGSDWLVVLAIVAPVLVGCVLLVWGLFWFYKWRSGIRRRAVRAANPTAVTAEMIIYPALVRQVNDCEAELTGRGSRIKPNVYAMLVADSTAMRIVGGSSTPQDWLSLPTSAITGISIGSAPSGVRIMPCLDVHLKTERRTMTLSIHLLDLTGVVPRSLRGDDLEDAVLRLRSALGGPAPARTAPWTGSGPEVAG